ncbi:PadR family transcriptional regulator [Streptomyces sp. NPDC002577]
MSAVPRSSPLALTVLALLHYEPLHPYGIQRRLKQWGKDLVVNVGQRAALYRTIERLEQAGLVAVRETGRDQAYPERTVYEVTDAGREVAREWLVEMLAVPRQEFPQFPAALSQLLLLTPQEIPEILQRRLAAVTEQLSGLEEALAEGGEELPRVTLLEVEYLRAVTRAEEQWLRGLIDDLTTGRLTWSMEELFGTAQALAADEADGADEVL